MATGQKIHISIIGTQYPAEVGVADEPIITVQEVEAEYFQKGESHYLFYEEHPEGFAAPLKTRVKKKGEMLEIQRKGPGGSTMYFAPKQNYCTEYYTPYGKLLLEIRTDKVLTESFGEGVWPRTIVEYALYSEEEILSNYRIVIEQKS